MTMRFSEAPRPPCRGSTLLVILSCLLFGFSYLGCAGNDHEPQRSTHSTAKTEPSPSKTELAPSQPPTAKVEPSPNKTESAPNQPSTEALPQREAAPLPQQPAVPQGETRLAETSVPVEKNVPQLELAPPAQKAAVPAEGKHVALAREETASQAKGASSSPKQVGIVTANRLNVRRSPDLSAAKVGSVPQGEKLEILGEEENWYHVATSDGSSEGWVAKRYIEVPSTAVASKAS